MEANISGGHFDYAYFQIDQFAEMLRNEIRDNKEIDDFGFCREYSDETISILNLIADQTELIGKIAKEVEWLYSGDTGEESFKERVIELLEKEQL